MKRNSFIHLCVIVFIVFAFLQTGAMLKSDGKYAVIARTQADPISHKAKMEELKDGEKGAPTPSFEHYGNEKFLIKQPVDEERYVDELPAEDAYAIPKLGDTIPPERDIKQEETDLEDWWFEDWNEASEPSEDKDFFM